MSIKIVGMDLGTTGVKASLNKDGVWELVVVDSLIATGKAKVVKKADGMFGKSEKHNGDELVLNGKTLFVGAGTATATTVYQPIVQSRFHDGSLLPLVLVALSKFNPEPNAQITLELSLPVSVMENDDQLETGIGGWLLGKHQYSVNGVDYSIDIINFDYDNQPLHAWVALTHNTEGRWVHPMSQEATFVVYDVGGGTFDFTTLTNYEINPQLSGGGQYGFYEAAKTLKVRLKDDYNLTFKLYHLSELIRQAAEGKEVKVFVNKKYVPHLAKDNESLVSVDISEMALSELDTMLNNVVGFVAETITTEMSEGMEIYLVGGPTNLQQVTDRFALEYPHINIEKNRHLAAMGAAIFGQMRQG